MARIPYNIEKSAFRHGEYVGWDCNGFRYTIRKDGPRKGRGSWWVYPTDEKCIPGFYAGTLALVSLRLERRQAICAKHRTLGEIAMKQQFQTLSVNGKVRICAQCETDYQEALAYYQTKGFSIAQESKTHLGGEYAYCATLTRKD